MNMLDPFTAEKLVASKQAGLRAEAKRAALRETLARDSHATDPGPLLRAIDVAVRRVRQSLAQVWNSGVRRVAKVARASR